MGIFDFLKKSKSDTLDMGMELPPIPKLEGLGGLDEFPEMSSEEIPPLPETMLPPLPTEVPTAVPPKPEERRIQTPKVELPKMAQMPEPPAFPEEPEQEAPQKSEFPALPTMPYEEVVPDRIPPLEGLPEPPAFSAAPEMEMMPQARPAPRRLEPSELPQTYFTPEEPYAPRKKTLTGPLFIRTDQFRTALENIELIRAKFSEEDDLFFRINEVKSTQDQRYEHFRQSLEDMQRKLLFIDKSLFEAR